MKRLLAVAILMLAATGIAQEADDATVGAVDERFEGDYLYRVTTVRAAPGQLDALINWISIVRDLEFFEEASVPLPLVMRHSQGDQWDLMFIVAMESWAAYHAPGAAAMRQDALEEQNALFEARNTMIAFEEDHFAYGPEWSVVENAYADNAFFHIEMFEAIAGKSDALLDQRRRENEYLEATGQRPNMIFRRAGGSDVDVFTIGFHPSLEAFAAPAPASDEEKEAAAVAAGFKNRADLSFFLRSLISGHHDTLATRVD